MSERKGISRGALVHLQSKSPTTKKEEKKITEESCATSLSYILNPSLLHDLSRIQRIFLDHSRLHVADVIKN